MLRISNVRKYLWIVSNFSYTLLLVFLHWWRRCIDIDVGLNRRPTQYNAKKIIAHVPTALKINPHYFATQLMFTKFPWAPPQACASGPPLGPPLEMLQSVLCISRYSKTLSRPIIYALFSQFFVRFWEHCPQIPTGAPPLDCAGGLSSPDP